MLNKNSSLLGQKPILAVAAILLALFPWFIYSGISKASILKVEET